MENCLNQGSVLKQVLLYFEMYWLFRSGKNKVVPAYCLSMFMVTMWSCLYKDIYLQI
jgi:hypothetical protein